MKVGLLLFAASACYGQAAVLTMTGPATALPGQSVTLNLALTGVNGGTVTGFQTGFTLPSGVTLGTPTASAGGVTAGKGVYCGTAICLEIGATNTNPPVLSNTPLTDGQAFSVQVLVGASVSGLVSIPLTGLLAVDTTGNAVTLTSGAAYSVRVLSRCDANQDGVTDWQDIQSVINSITRGTTCPLSGGCTLGSLVNVMRAALGGACTL